MKKLTLFSFALACSLIPGWGALTVSLNVDSAPNRYGSSAWAPWWDQTKADVAAGTFTDMRTGTFPGTHYIDPKDEIVYSTMDLGKRLHWIYWLPSQNTADLGNNFQVKWVIDWDGEDWTLDSYGDWAQDAPEVGWATPSSWENYSGGVIGSFGFAWWSTDNDAPPFSTDTSDYNEVNQADIDALRNEVLLYQTHATGYIRYRESGSAPWQYADLRVEVVPEPGTLFAGALLLLPFLAGTVKTLRRSRRN